MTLRRTPLMDISGNDMTSTPPTANRRKSGRAVKVPEKFTPNVPSSQQVQSSAKRKRGVQDVENDASDVEEDEDSDEESEETVESAEEEEVPAPRKKTKASRKPAAKKPKVNGTESHGDAVKLASRPKKVAIADRNAEGLYADIYTSGNNLEDVAGQFLAKYENNKVEAVKELINLVLKSAGCDIQVTEDDIEDPDNIGGRLGDIQEEHQANNVADYPLVSKAKSSHDFRTNLSNFFQNLIEAMHKTEVMYEADIPLIDNIHLWLATMTSCTSRPFRHTATLVSLAVSRGLCAMVAYEIEVAAQIRRQLEGEKKKKGANKGRLADYQQRIQTGEQKQEALKSKIYEFFDTVYVHRYRDVDPKIRAECVEAIGDWINILPSMFLEGKFLRYLGWMLSDTYAPVRHVVIKQLHRILKNEDNFGTMRHFLERFRPRLIEIAAQDSETDVRASAIKTLDLVREAGMLEPNDIDAIGKLIFDSDLQVRKAVVGFFLASMQDLYDLRVEELGGKEDLEELLAVDDEDFESPREGWIKLKVLAESLFMYDAQDQDEMPSQIQTHNDSEFLNVSGTESRFTHAAQALYDKALELMEWQMLAGYLLYDHSSKPTGNKTQRALKEALKPTEEEEVILLECLNAVVKRALPAQADETSADKSRAEKAKENSKKSATKAELAGKKQETARQLAGLIPRLLKKYGANPKTVTIVLRLEHILDLDIYQKLRQSTAYSRLLDEISMQFKGHADRGVLTEAGAALLHARSYGDLEEVTENKVQSLWEDTINTLCRINKIAIRGSFRDATLTELSHNLARLDKLASISNCIDPLETPGRDNEPLPINILLDLVSRGTLEKEDPDHDALEDEIVLSATRSSMFYFMWKIHSLTESISVDEGLLDVDIDNLSELQELFITNLISSLSRATLDPVRLFAAGTLLDLYVLFSTLRLSKESKPKNGTTPADVDDQDKHFQSLVKEIAPKIQQELTAIFDQAEKQFAKKGKKKLAEPGDDEAPEDLDSESEEDDDEDATDSEQRAEVLKAEQALCELTGKLVLGILAGVIDASGPLKGKLRSRLQRNKEKLGPNYKKVVEYLDEPKPKSKSRNRKSRVDQAAAVASKKAEKEKSARTVVSQDEEQEEDDPFAELEVEEGNVEDLRRRELDEEPPTSVAEDDDDLENEDEDEIMGD